MLRRCAGRATAVSSPCRRALPSPVLSGVPLPTPPKSAEDFACNTQHGGQRPCGATLRCFSCARTQLPASLADNGCPTFPAARPTITPCCSAPTAVGPPFRPSRLTLPEMPIYSRAAFSPERFCALNARNMPEHSPKKHCHAAAERCAARKTPFFTPSPKNFASNAPRAPITLPPRCRQP